ncbi:hypothetical protein [Bacterioplanoides sp.]|uniref:hypothetical protein n=1 Tax=Bacterioplanoides sp. TaxID=2066072 RepID=UPI003B00C555
MLILLLLSACEDSQQPILRGVKQTIDRVLETPATEQNVEQSNDQEVTAESEKQPLNLNIPDDILSGEMPDIGHEPVWGPNKQKSKTAILDQYRVLPDLFDTAPSDDESTMGVSGKLHWDETEEELDETIPRLRDIKGAELEISVKTR